MSAVRLLYGTPEQAWQRRVLLALELIDGVTLSRVWQGVEVRAEGLAARPIVNGGGVFVWLGEDATGLSAVTVNPGAMPFEPVRLEAAQLQWPHTVVTLQPRADYAFPAGIAALRGRVVQSLAPPLAQRVPLADAQLRLAWLDEDGVTWHDAPGTLRSDARGSYAAVLRLLPGDMPQLDAQGVLSVRLHVRREALAERRAPVFALPRGRVADAPTYAWDDLQP